MNDSIVITCLAVSAACGLLGYALARKARKSEKRWQLVISAVMAVICVVAVGVGLFFAIKIRHPF